MLRLHTARDSERAEAMAGLLQALALLLLAALALLGVMRWNLRRAFEPLQVLLAANGGAGAEVANPAMGGTQPHGGLLAQRARDLAAHRVGVTGGGIAV